MLLCSSQHVIACILPLRRTHARGDFTQCAGSCVCVCVSVSHECHKVCGVMCVCVLKPKPLICAVRACVHAAPHLFSHIVCGVMWHTQLCTSEERWLHLRVGHVYTVRGPYIHTHGHIHIHAYRSEWPRLRGTWRQCAHNREPTVNWKLRRHTHTHTDWAPVLPVVLACVCMCVCVPTANHL